MQRETLEDWLEAMAMQPLPGGVAAAAMAGALGAALMAKATRLTLQRQALQDLDRKALEDTLDQAHSGRKSLVRLSETDQDAYRAVIEAERAASGPPARDAAWQAAIERPLQVAESCHTLLGRALLLRAHGWPAINTEVQTAAWLLEAAQRAALLAARDNLDHWDGGPLAEPFRRRIQTLSTLRLQEQNDD
jgi:formiminotetrahydrofolate cyclodeaminase